MVGLDRFGRVTRATSRALEIFGWAGDCPAGGRYLSDALVGTAAQDRYRVTLAEAYASAGTALHAASLVVPATGPGDRSVDIELVLLGPGRSGPDAELYAVITTAVGDGEGVVLMGASGVVDAWSPGAQRLLGYDAAEAVGRRLVDLLQGDDPDLAAELGRTARGGVATTRAMDVQAKGGIAVKLHLRAVPLHDESGGAVGSCAIMRGRGDQVRSATGDHEDMARRLVADAAHQLRSPIAGIQACTETLLLGVEPDKHDRLLTNIVRETERASQLMTALLKMARLDQGADIALAPCDLAALCCDEVDRAATLAPHLDMVLQLPSRVPFAPQVDAAAVREILSNLLDNARRHATGTIELHLSFGPDQVECRVIDDGPGLPLGQEDQAFERFASLDAKGGSGLGLPIAQGLARAHGGDLTYDRPAFVLRLPVLAAATRLEGASPVSLE